LVAVLLHHLYAVVSMLFLESKLEYTFSVFDNLNSTFTIWHYKFSIYYKFVIVINLVYAPARD